jgi:FkbM family methyltransferase
MGSGGPTERAPERRSGPVELLAAVSRRLPPFRGKPSLAWRLMRRAERRGALQGAWRVRLKDGTPLELPRQSRMGWAVAFTGLYDRAAVERVAEFIRPGTVVLDVGASLGLWTVQLGKLADARGARLWAFEPNPENTRWIARNVALSNLGDTVTTREMGLGDRAESAILVGAEYGVGNGAIALRERAGTTKHPRIPVSLGRLDEIELPAPVSFIKVDVEGYELAFLRGAMQLIERDRPVIFGEFGSGWLERRGDDLRSALAGLDYDVSALARPKRAFRLTSSRALEARRIDLSSPERVPENLLLQPRTRQPATSAAAARG